MSSFPVKRADADAGMLRLLQETMSARQARDTSLSSNGRLDDMAKRALGHVRIAENLATVLLLNGNLRGPEYEALAAELRAIRTSLVEKAPEPSATSNVVPVKVEVEVEAVLKRDHSWESELVLDGNGMVLGTRLVPAGTLRSGKDRLKRL